MRSLSLALLIAARPGAAQEVQAEADLRLHELHSRVFRNTRLLRVLVPEEYDAPGNRARKYPVLYLNDGQNLFDSATALFNPMEWRIDETVRRLVTLREIPPLIVVGIDNAGRRGRAREYLPYVDAYLRPAEPDPLGERYPEFLVEEVLPFVNVRYRTLRGAEHTGLGGSSYGGLASLFAVIARSGVFGRLLVESPSLYVDSAAILRDAALAVRWPERIYLGVGTNEGGRPECKPEDPREPEAVADVRRLARLLSARVDSSRVLVVVEPCAVHNEAAWARRLPAPLRCLFAP